MRRCNADRQPRIRRICCGNRRVEIGHLTETVNPAPLVGAYIRSLRSGTYSLSTDRIKASGARALVELAMRASAERWNEFLSPLNVSTFLARGKEPDANEFIIANELGRSIRAHIRVLCRAIAAWEEVPPPDLVNFNRVRRILTTAERHDHETTYTGGGRRSMYHA